MSIYFADGTVTHTDRRKGIWTTINHKGIKRIRKLKDSIVYDEVKRVKIEKRVDPETNAEL